MPITKVKGKKDGLQKYRVRVNYTDSNGAYKQVERIAYGLEQAKDMERELLISKDKPVATAMTVRQLCNEYIAVKSHEVRETSLKGISDKIKHHIIPHLGDVDIQKLNAKTIQNWKLTIEQCTNSKGEPLSGVTKKNIYGALRGLINYAVKMEYIDKSPLKSVGNFKDAYTASEEMDYYTPEEFQKFISAAKACAEEQERDKSNLNEWNYYVFFCIAFYTGLRKGEIYALKWSDIEDNILSVSRSINQKLKGDDRETPPKNKSSIRKLQIPIPLQTVLAEQKKRLKTLPDFSNDYRVCPNVRDTTLEHKNRKYANAAGIKKIRIHDFRHSHVSVLANNGINIQEIARRLGHAEIEITWNIYSHLYPREEEKAVNILNQIQLFGDFSSPNIPEKN